ncbi:hypothetical protein C8R46DRAFT_498038 [Mycena filopes]|nr:hypothetical protein C8R46DRAFT_498038 [Mycena filopes]
MSSTAMDRALKIPELLKLICLEVGAPSYDRHDKPSRDLASLARTCTTISAPALDVLWFSQNTIMNLLRLMPLDLRKKDWVLRRPIVETDWIRPRMYMHRIRSLSCTPTSFPKAVDVTVLFDTIRLSLPTPYLCPNLRTLSWQLGSAPSVALVPLLLAPGITDLVLGTFTAMCDLTVLGTLASRCALLKKVKLTQIEIREFDQSRAVSSFVRGLKHVRALEIRTMDRPAFEHLSGLDHLDALTVTRPYLISNLLVIGRPGPPISGPTSSRTSRDSLPNCHNFYRSPILPRSIPKLSHLSS